MSNPVLHKVSIVIFSVLSRSPFLLQAFSKGTSFVFDFSWFHDPNYEAPASILFPWPRPRFLGVIPSFPPTSLTTTFADLPCRLRPIKSTGRLIIIPLFFLITFFSLYECCSSTFVVSVFGCFFAFFGLESFGGGDFLFVVFAVIDVPTPPHKAVRRCPFKDF